MSISTSSQYDQAKWEVKRLVTANHTEAVSLARGLFAGIGAIFGGPNDMMNKKIEDVVEQLKIKISQQISPGECVVGFHMQFAEFGRSESNTYLSGSASGTILMPKFNQGSIPIATSMEQMVPAAAPAVGPGGRRTRKQKQKYRRF